MTKQTVFTITALSERHDVFRRRFDELAFLRRYTQLSDQGSEPEFIDRIAILPRSAFERDEMQMFTVFDQAKTHLASDNKLLLPHSATTSVRTLGELKALAVSTHLEEKSSIRRLNLVAEAHFGRPYAQLKSDLISALVTRFERAFDDVWAVHMDYGARPAQHRDIITSLDSRAEQPIIDEMMAVADEGHAYAAWIAALLLTSAAPLTPRAVDFLLMAHDAKLPHALTTLAERLLVEGGFVEALEIALLAAEAGSREAHGLLTTMTRLTAGMVVLDGGPMRSLMRALVQEVIGPRFFALARVHLPAFTMSASEMANEAEAAMLARLNGRMRRG